MKIKAVITGPKVQGVGYRVFLMHQAIIEGIERFAALNVSDDTVVVLAEADDEKISSLKELLLTRRPEHAQVSEVRIEEFDGRVMTLQEATILNTAVQMNKAIPILISMDGKLDRIDKTTERMDGKLDRIDKTTGRMEGKLDRIDKTTERMEGKLDRIDKTTERMEGKLEMIGETQEENVNEVRGLRVDLGTIHAGRMERMERDIAEIKAKIGLS